MSNELLDQVGTPARRGAAVTFADGLDLDLAEEFEHRLGRRAVSARQARRHVGDAAPIDVAELQPFDDRPQRIAAKNVEDGLLEFHSGPHGDE
ncbi:MAG TPA: hypothetical protein VND64_18280 [Pirellulales bacterium]|nr:hypothetical protein [Pirellulales bacterium]